MNRPSHKTEGVNHTKTMRFYPSVSTGKEKDTETGYGYFGARYMDHELMTMWLSVDPMADKYPSISPYAYCAWNPIKLVDPDGNEWDPASKNIIDRFRKTTEQKRDEASSIDIRMKYQEVLDELDELDVSSQVYHVETGSDGNINRTGGTSYDLSNDWVSIDYDGTDASLAHELKHAYQFEKGEITFSSITGGWADIVCNESGQCINRVLFYDLTDEVAAFQRGVLYGAADIPSDYIANRYCFKIDDGNRYCYPFLDKAIHGENNIYLGNNVARSLPSNANPDKICLKGNIYRINGQTYKK